MKPSVASVIVVAVLAAILVSVAFLAASYLDLHPAAPSAGHVSSKDFVSAIATAVISGLLLALLVLLIPDRWRRIESEVLSLRQGQDKALDELRKRADERIGEKLDSASRQAQGLLDHISGLTERHPWIKGVSEAGFTPNSNSCQIVIRNAAKLVAEGQGLLAHDYLFSWTRPEEGRAALEGSPYDFLQIAEFALFVLRDEYLAMLIVSIGYHSRAGQLVLAPTHLRALSRNGMIRESFDIAESIRRRALPTWREQLREAWYKLIRIGKPTVRPPRPTADDCSSLAIFFGILGNETDFKRAIARARTLAATDKERLRIVLAEAESSASLGSLERASDMIRGINKQEVLRSGIVFELVWALRRANHINEAEELLTRAASNARKLILRDFSTDKALDGGPLPAAVEPAQGDYWDGVTASQITHVNTVTQRKQVKDSVPLVSTGAGNSPLARGKNRKARRR